MFLVAAWDQCRKKEAGHALLVRIGMEALCSWQSSWSIEHLMACLSFDAMFSPTHPLKEQIPNSFLPEINPFHNPCFYLSVNIPLSPLIGGCLAYKVANGRQAGSKRGARQQGAHDCS